MDRLGPARRPEGRNAGTQRWSDLLFVHYEVEPEALAAQLPAGLSLDTFEGRAFVGLVPFRMERIAPPLWPPALGLNFLETNLRTYVHVEGDRPGVYFFSLEAASWLAVRIARWLWRLPYFDAAMSVTVDQGVRDYRTTRRGGGPHLRARFRTGQPLGHAAPGTLEHFLLERYLLYVERDGALWSGQVHHAPYPMQAVELLDLEETLCAAAGIERPPGPPPLAHASPGVDVEVFAIRPARPG
ncbi:MAG: DUF2071 domain-containing protein [Alphaproteobacteria bacterium]|nr:DUF2071 domain-containing protein [Alphaproteobacteria bacterium]